MRKLAQWLNGEAPYILKGVVYKMKKNLTKLLALMMALALVFSLAACGGDDTTGDSSEANAGASNNAEETLDPADPDATVPSGEESTVEGQSGETQNDATTPNGDKVTTPGGKTDDPATTKANTDTGLNTTDKAQVVDAYKKAASAAGKIKRVQYMKLTKFSLSESGKDSSLKGIAEKLVGNADGQTGEGIPGNFGALTANDVSSAKATTKNGVTTINIVLNNQTDYAQGYPGTKKDDAWGAGPVGHGVGVLGSIDSVVSQIPGCKVENEKDVTVTYTNAKINATIKNGKVVSGDMSYVVQIKAKVKIVIASFNGSGTIQYNYKIG